MSRQPTGTRNIRFFRRSALLALVALLPGLTSGVTPRSGSLDPEFTRLPFEEWAKRGKQSGMHWSVEVSPAQLSPHQRLMVRINITIDGRDVARRLADGGRFIGLVQLEDGEHRVWQNHASFRLEDMQKGVAASNIEISQFAFVMPGDYTVSLAVCDTATLEHNFVTRRLHVAPLRNDPLPDSWAGLPAVEFVQSGSDSSDILYLPRVAGRLNLPAPVKRPVHLQLIVNMTPSERASGSATALRRNMSLLIPALKVFSAVKLSAGTMDVALLDLTRQRVAWEQKNVRELDWRGIRRALKQDEPGRIDVRDLQDRGLARKFFVEEVSRRMAADAKAARVVIVLSGPAFFPNQDLAEVSLIANDPDAHLIYIRDRSVPPLGRGRSNQFSLPEDDMERALRPLSPRVYDSVSAMHFRQILAGVLRQLAQM